MSASHAPTSHPESLELVATLEIGVKEDFAARVFEQVRGLRVGTKRYRPAFADGVPAHPAGTVLRIRGEISGDVLTVRDSEVVESAPSLAGGSAGETLGEQRTLVTLVHFTHDPTEPYAVSEVDDLLLDEANPQSMASYVREVSYQRAWLTGQTLGWFSMPYDDSSCLVWTPSGTQQLIDGLDASIDFSQWDRWFVVIPQNAGCGFQGFSSSGKETYTSDDGTVTLSRAILNGLEMYPAFVAAHELGHGLAALQHSADYECGTAVAEDQCTSPFGDVTDRFDIMGHVPLSGHYSPPNKEQLGWFGGEVVDVVPPGGSFSIEPYETLPTGTKVLRIPVPWVLDDLYGSTHYTIAYRKPIGFDSGFGELTFDDGAHVHLDARRFTGGRYGRSRLLDMSPHVDPASGNQQTDSSFVRLKVGETYDDLEHGVSFSVTGVTGGELQVAVSISQYCGSGTVDAALGEECDGADLGAQTCESLGFAAGLLDCSSSCELDVSRCGMARCAAGDAFDDVAQACTASILSDPTDGNLWRNRPSWTECRESPVASGSHTDSQIFLLNRRRTDDFSWIYRDSLPFDTSRLPAGQPILAGGLTLKVLGFPPIVNTHPALADQLVLVQTTFASPPGFVLEDFDRFGALDSPIEGAPRVDIGDSIVADAEVGFDLNVAGLSWIDPDGWTLLGLRGGYDVDDVILPGEESQINLSFRSSESPLFGPRLTVTYGSLALPPGGAAGAVEGLIVDRLSPAELSLTWGASCNGPDSDYEVYEGMMGNFSSHVPLACSTGGETGATVTAGSGGRYYLVVPRSADREGSHGVRFDGERPRGAESCLGRAVASCGQAK
jgi:hypothetical protein